MNKNLALFSLILVTVVLFVSACSDGVRYAMPKSAMLPGSNPGGPGNYTNKTIGGTWTCVPECPEGYHIQNSECFDYNGTCYGSVDCIYDYPPSNNTSPINGTCVRTYIPKEKVASAMRK